MFSKAIKQKLINNSQWLINSLIATLALTCWVQPSQAEGSRSLYPSGATGNRANIEWRNSNYANIIKRRTLLKVYANRGEYILLGSSAVGVNSGDIKVYNPGLVTGAVGNESIPSSASFSCSAQRTATGNATQGQIYTTTTPNITARQRELAGPNTITNAATATPGNAVTNGYVPCFYQAPQTGIYSVVFYGPTGDNSNSETAPTGDIANVQTDAAQNTSVAAWDVTVRSSLTSTTDILGRLFADYLALFTGANSRPVNSKLFIVTRDGFKYLTNLNGVDPNGFVILANDIGFYDSDGKTPLYHNLVDGVNDQLTAPQGGVTLSLPKHLIFFTDNTQYQPDSAALTENGISLSPIAPTISGLSYTGSAGGINSYVAAGGTFSYSSNVTGNYEIIISRNGTDFDPSNPQNRVLRGVRTSSGTQTVTWNGFDNSGTAFPTGTNYQVRASVNAGEYHFPLLDPENSANGGPSYTLVNPPGTCPGVAGCSTAFYDDRGYRTLNGSTVGTVNTLLPSGTHPGAASSLTGFNSTTTQRSFSSNFGDKRGLDFWTYFPSSTATVLLNIIASVQRDLQITKTHSGDFNVGQNGVYTLTVKNVGTINFTGSATNVLTITDTLPSGLSYASFTSTTTGWNCSASGQIVTCTHNSISLATNVSSSINLTVSVSASAAASVSNIATLSVSTATNDTVASNNTATDPTNIIPQANLSITKTHTGNFSAGQNATYTITVSNSNLSTAVAPITVTDDLPTGLTFVSTATGTSAGWSCSASGQKVTCTNSNNLVANANSTIKLTAAVSTSAAASVSNIATVSSTTNDPSTANNTTTDVATVNFPAHLRLIKRITRIKRKDGTVNTFNTFVDDGTANNDDNAPYWPTPFNTYLPGKIDGGNVSPGDEVEYTIYFLSDGTSPAQKVNVCDLVPVNTTFVTNAFNGLTPTDGGTAGANYGIALALSSSSLPTAPTFYLTNIADAPDRGEFFSAGTTPSISCAASNTNGAVVVKVVANPTTLPQATAPGTPTNSYGFIRFRAKVN